MSKRAALHNHTPDVPFKKHKKLDLRGQDHYEKFNCHKFVFKVNSTPIDVTTHTSTEPKEEEKIHDVVEHILREGLDYMHSKDIPPYAVIHIYMHCEGMESDFRFCGAGANKITLKQMREGRISDIVHMFGSIIQSGRDVFIDDHTVITFYAYIPPVEYR